MTRAALLSSFAALLLTAAAAEPALARGAASEADAAALPGLREFQYANETFSLKAIRVVLVVRTPWGAAADFVDALEGMSPADVAAMRFDVMRGWVCSSLMDVASIAGLGTDVARGRFWELRVNSDRLRAHAHYTRLKEGDVIEWIYHDGW